MVEEKNISTEQLENKISSGYKKLYTFTFKKLPIILFILIILFVFYFFILKNSNDDIQIDQMRLNNEESIRANYEKLYGSMTRLSDEVKLFIKDGYLQQDDSNITSVGNLLRVKGWIMPHIANINIDLLPEITSFVTTGYAIEDLENIIRNVVIESNVPFRVYDYSRKTLTIDDFESYFSLSCLKGIKVDDYICDQYVDIFLDSFYLYDLKQHPEQLSEIYSYLDDKQKNKFCEGVVNHVLFTHADSSAIGKIISHCGKTHLSNYSRYKNFFSMKEALVQGVVSEKNIYSNQLDIYLILSLQQNIASDIARNSINTNVIYSYLSAIDKAMLLKLDKNILGSEIYYDWVFWFNEYILKQGLEKARYSQPNIQSDIERIIPEILKINNGKPAAGVKGLKYYVLNKDILSIDRYLSENDNDIDLDPLQRVSDLVNDLSFFALTDNYYKSDIIKDTIVLKGYFIVELDGSVLNLNTTLELDPGDFRVSLVNIDGYSNFNKTLNRLISVNYFSIPDLYQYIEKNIRFYLESQKLDFCSMLEDLLEGKELDLENEKSYRVHCIPGKVYISGGGLNYAISINNFSVTNIIVDDATLEQDLNKKFIGDTPSELDLVSLIEEIVYYKVPENEGSDAFTGSTKVIVVLDTIKEYMNIKAQDVVEQGDIILAEIVVQDIPFIIHYDFDTDTIKTVFFKGMKISPNSDTFLKVPNFNLQLRKENQKKINLFLIEPLEYIKKKNPYVYLQYLRNTKNKN